MEEQEISLRELIEILLKNKYLIASITIICVFVSVIFSFFIIKPTYESEAKIIVSDIEKKESLNGIEGIIDQTSKYPDFNLESYKEQIKNHEIINKVITELSLNPQKYTQAAIANAITLENVKNTNLIKIKVKDTDSETAAKIANSLASNFSEYISEINKKQSLGALDYIGKQLKEEEENLNEAMLEYKNFLQNSISVEELESEKSLEITLLSNFKNVLSEIDIELLKNQANLNEAEEQLKNTEKYLITTNNIVDNTLLSDYLLNEKEKSFGELAEIKLQNEQINPLFISLQEKISNCRLYIAELKAQKNSLQGKITETQKNLAKIQVALTEKKHEDDILNRKVNNARNIYNAYLDKSEEIRLLQSTKIGENTILVSSQAYPTKNPVSPRKTLNLAIALVLGIMLGAFIAFFKEYWLATGIKQ